jgi:hypothetical protein
MLALSWKLQTICLYLHHDVNGARKPSLKLADGRFVTWPRVCIRGEGTNGSQLFQSHHCGNGELEEYQIKVKVWE